MREKPMLVSKKHRVHLKFEASVQKTEKLLP